MLLIRKKQLEELRIHKTNDFLNRMCEFVCDNFTIDNPNSLFFHEEVHNAIKEAQHFDFEMEEEIENFIFVKWRYAEMKQQPLPENVVTILEFPDRSAERKIHAIQQLLCYQYRSPFCRPDWQAAPQARRCGGTRPQQNPQAASGPKRQGP